jgi:hypothetical protein
MSSRAFGNPPWEMPGWTTPRAVIAWSLVAAGVGLVALALGLLVDPSRAWFAYLAVWTFGATLCIGALLLLMAGHAAKAGWMVVTRRLTEAVVDALPLYFLLFIPLAFGLAHVYPWASHTASTDPLVQHAIDRKRGYLNPPFFIVRTVFYFALFGLVGGLLRAWSKKNDREPSIGLVRRMRRLGAGGLPPVGLALTWASFDWTMSLEPDWHSTIYGLYYFAGSLVAALSLSCVMLQASRMRRVPRALITAEHGHALGRLLFAMVIFWAYMAFSQLLIYWISDIPREVTFYIRRTSGSWNAVTFVLVVGHLVVPFFLLLGRRAKRRLDFLASVGAFMLLMHFVDVYWLVMPAHDPTGVRPHWLDIGGVLFIGGLSCAFIVHRYFTAPPIPLHVPELAEGLDYEAAL